MTSRQAFGAEFPGAAGFLNSPTYGLPPGFLIGALHDCLAAWQAGTLDAKSFDQPVRDARAGYAALVGVPVDSVAMAGSASAALGLVAAAIPDGSRGATLAGEFTSTTFPFAAQAARGVSLTELCAAELVATAGDYDFVTVSLVQSATGALLDVETLRASVAGTDTTTIVDVTQAAGWKLLDLGWADVTVASVYKWLLAPRGTAFLSLSARIGGSVTPHAANWYAGDRPWESIYGLPPRLAADARRFDTSPAWFGALGAGLTLPWLAGLDLAAVEAHTVGLADTLRAELDLPPNPSAIVSLPSARGEDTAERLRQAGIRASVRAGAVRVGFHLYNTADDLDRLLTALA
ncbi:aminotransferase class V-fold PLP-dependent enzyme [Mycolicibacterium litorale]|uniref:Aminotransferase class V n=1 Tax=Mycolicibacterium litorale TaxID=758802 RepID=A0AAD1IL63_9MYCO|nr:aminotransferase class V-fold PLP-dependent enzyme [Mycolicibacterium litorale]MCV7416654.1 aminotransferase class V-fold PLP-dependent enzyme [Mycolicibacterium litorale]TDY09907.1 selenocysteine lyase/cysteine desulfurase [Mycolicibacterium litorale]BBY17867.1 aminotransferase class V [Mycolicibacterium litorale]